MNIMNTACMVCHANNTKINKLQNIERFLRRFDLKPATHTFRFAWDLNERCRYGIPSCNKIRQFEVENNAIVNRIEPQLTSFIESADEGVLRELLALLRGDFPRVYKQAEREFYSRRKERVGC